MFASADKEKLTRVSGTPGADGLSSGAMEESFAERLRRLRDERGLSQKALEELSGVFVHMIEKRGSPRPPYETVTRLARALDVDPDELAGVEPPPITPTLAEFLKTEYGKTAKPDEIARLRRIPASGKRPSRHTYEVALTMIRGMEDAPAAKEHR